MKEIAQARELANYILSLPNFDTAPQERYIYHHMGALIADAILQTGVNYKTIVKPRIRRILREFPDATTSSVFYTILSYHGADKVLNWRHAEKPRRAQALTGFLVQNGIETEGQLKTWLLSPSHCALLLDMRGIGPKTVDYLKILVGCEEVAVDRHVRAFVVQSGVKASDYREIKILVCFAADLLGVSRHSLDQAIWSYMTNAVNENAVQVPLLSRQEMYS